MPKLGEILEQVSRSEPVDLMKEYHLLGIRLEGGGAFHRETKLGSQVSANIFFKVKSGDFIYSRLFAWRGAFDVIDNSLDSFYVSNEFPTFMHKKDKINTEFLRLWFRLPGTIAKVEALCSGSTPLTRNRLKEDKFLNLEIPLPSLEEQRRIVARIEELAAKIEEARGLRREVVKESEILIDVELDRAFNDLSKHTQSIVFGEVGGFVTSGSRGWGNYYSDNGHRRLIRVENVVNDVVDLSRAKKVEIPSDEGDIERSQVQINDVLVTITGAAIGRMGIVTQFDMPCHVSQHVALMRVPQTIYPYFLYWYLRSPTFGRSQTEGKIYGATKPGINLTDLRTIRIITPSIEEQYDIVAYFNGLQAKINILKKKQAEASAELNALLPSILDKAFKGEL